MKAVLCCLLAAVGSYATIITFADTSSACVLPSSIATASTATTGVTTPALACLSIDPRYSLRVLCTSDANTVSQQLTATAASFGALATDGTPGCYFPSEVLYFGSGATTTATDATFGLGVGSTGAACPAYTNLASTSPTIKSLLISCSSGYYPIDGSTGLATLLTTSNLVCAAGAAATNYATQTQTFGFNSGTTAVFVPPPGVDTADLPAFTSTGTAATDSLFYTCAAGCTLPVGLCANGLISGPFQVYNYGTGVSGLVPNTCTIRPGTTIAVYDPTSTATVYRITCSANTGNYSAAGTLTYVDGVPPLLAYTDAGYGFTGAFSGYVTQPLYPLSQSVAAGFLSDYPLVSSYLRTSSGATISQWGGNKLNQRFNPAQPFYTGYAQTVIVYGCSNYTTSSNQVVCAQEAINYWRCRGFTIDSGSYCFALGVRIACPTDDNGFGCSSSSGSKKGLLGLLGLLGLIPLCLLLLCCCLIPCCLRRRKTEADVHFATFDPHAAPVAASVIAPAIPTALCAPTAVCAEPCVEPFVGSYGAQFAAPATPIF